LFWFEEEVKNMADKAKKIGSITHYYSKLGVGIIKLDNKLKVGDKVRIEGNSSDFEQTVSQIQFDHEDIDSGKKGQEVGIKVKNKVREGDKVFLVE